MNISFETALYTALALVPAALGALIWRGREKYIFLRFFIYLAAFFLLLRPHFTVSRPVSVKPSIGVFVDSSRSMSLENRMDKAVGAAEEFLQVFEGEADISLFRFDSGAPVRVSDPGKIIPDGDATNITSVLGEGRFDARVILTDGNYNRGGNPLASPLLGRTPVFTVGVGGDSAVPDLEIADLRVPAFGFRNQELEIEFDLLNRTEESDSTRVYIYEGRSVVATKELHLQGEPRVPVSISFTPEETGLKNYRLRVNPLPGEVNTVNNLRNFQVQINREKIRILYVAGRPTWEYSFFRRLITSDPQVELVSFLILRNPENETIVPENELSLIHFPAREMFTREIYNFDLLIYDNFSYRRFFPRVYLEHIKDFVSEGGGFIMTGGEDSFRRGGYEGTPVEEILPVEFSPDDSRWVVEEFSPRPASGLSHPLVNLARDEEVSARIWEDMPELEGYDPSLRPRPGSTVLLEGPGRVPVLSVMNYGRGRVMAFNANSTWRWCLGLAGQDRSPFYYNEFWQGVVRYMIQSAEHSNVRVFPGRDRVGKGERVRFNIKVVDNHWNPVDGAGVTVELAAPSGRTLFLGEALPEGDKGWYSISAPVEEEGVYRVSADAVYGGETLGQDRAEFSGIEVDPEMVETALNRSLLKEMSRISGGGYYPVSELEAEEILSAVHGIHRGRDVFRRVNWHWAPFYILIITVMCLEWFLRRRRGLV